jgi:hypothetical protein
MRPGTVQVCAINAREMPLVLTADESLNCLIVFRKIASASEWESVQHFNHAI